MIHLLTDNGSGQILSDKNKKQLWIPGGFAHGFLVLSEVAEVIYKTTNYYSPEKERCIIWNDPTLQVKWPIKNEPVLSANDKLGDLFPKMTIQQKLRAIFTNRRAKSNNFSFYWHFDNGIS